MDRLRAAADRSASREERIAAARDRRSSAFDDLTSAYRRDAGIHLLERSFDTVRETDTAMAICFVDVDGLKMINDTDGHLAGDRILSRVAAVIDSHLGCDDTLLRYGGDKFTFSVLGHLAADIEETISAIATALREGENIAITCGTAFAHDWATVADAIEHADKDLYRRRRTTRKA
ncbi:GGDEF domain-containing protein [Rhodococcus fascians]|nr:GGDEF domain-containing protein [Rhodococcus fascians]MBY3999473.1 GGDEF domain-containing protein [Rhodococcus fascians]MBY4005006.1 GGDEF domain-containing protein [Rhodococcus fascians]MBY4010121.1 GGDEF domain-containing protein [Rhodococcus fascians]MBY4020213.1 GGDEF domain-containing protein [Rhodococcus fascians]